MSLIWGLLRTSGIISYLITNWAIFLSIKLLFLDLGSSFSPNIFFIASKLLFQFLLVLYFFISKSKNFWVSFKRSCSSWSLEKKDGALFLNLKIKCFIKCFATLLFFFFFWSDWTFYEYCRLILKILSY